MAECRAVIDAADDEIMAALNRRLEAHRRLHDHKTANGYPLFDAGREQAILDRLNAHNEGPLDAGDVGRLVSAILAISGQAVHRLRGTTPSAMP